MSVQNVLQYKIDLSQGTVLTPLRMVFIYGEALAHQFHIHAHENGQKVDLTGAKVNGYMMRADQTTLPFSGSVSNGEAVIALPAAAYSVVGRFRLAIQAVKDGVTTTLLYAEGAVSPSTTDIIAIPDEIAMPSLENIEAMIEEMTLATAAANAAVQGALVRNFLDNAAFQVAQAGYNVAHGTVPYYADRWFLATWQAEVSATRTWGDAVTLKGGVADIANSAHVRQNIPADGLAGQAITVAVEVPTITSAGGARLIVLTDGTASGDTVTYKYKNITAGMVVINMTVPADATTVSVLIGNQASYGGTGEINFIFRHPAVYLGTYTADTLPGFQPRTYTEELMECRRYYQRFTYSFYAMSAWSAYQGHLLFPVTARIYPTIVIKSQTNGTEGCYTDKSASNADVDGATANNIDWNGCRLCSTGTLTAGHQYTCTLEVMADL